MSDYARVPPDGNPPLRHTDRSGSAERRRNRDGERIRSQREGRSCTRQALARGFTGFEEMATGGADTVTAIAKRERVTEHYVSRLAQLPFIDPRIIQRVLEGTARSTISTTRLVFRTKLPSMWLHQGDASFAS